MLVCVVRVLNLLIVLFGGKGRDRASNTRGLRTKASLVELDRAYQFSLEVALQSAQLGSGLAVLTSPTRLLTTLSPSVSQGASLLSK